MITFQTMQPGEIKDCVNIAAEAFGSYDFFRAYVTDDNKRPRYLRSMMITEYRVNRDKMTFFTAKENGKIIATAIVRAPGYVMPTTGEYIKAGFWRNILIAGLKNVAAWFEMDQDAGLPCSELKEAYFLHLLAVDRSMEGKGIGSRMLKECIIPYAKEMGAGTLCLYTNSEINCRFYEKNGFRQFENREYSYGGVSFGSWSYRMDF